MHIVCKRRTWINFEIVCTLFIIWVCVCSILMCSVQCAFSMNNNSKRARACASAAHAAAVQRAGGKGSENWSKIRSFMSFFFMDATCSCWRWQHCCGCCCIVILLPTRTKSQKSNKRLFTQWILAHFMCTEKEATLCQSLDRLQWIEGQGKTKDCCEHNMGNRRRRPTTVIM